MIQIELCSFFKNDESYFFSLLSLRIGAEGEKERCLFGFGRQMGFWYLDILFLPMIRSLERKNE